MRISFGYGLNAITHSGFLLLASGLNFSVPEPDVTIAHTTALGSDAGHFNKSTG
jgi:hypothetical protein